MSAIEKYSAESVLVALRKGNAAALARGDRFFFTRQRAFVFVALQLCHCGGTCPGCKAATWLQEQLLAANRDAEQADPDGAARDYEAALERARQEFRSERGRLKAITSAVDAHEQERNRGLPVCEGGHERFDGRRRAAGDDG